MTTPIHIYFIYIWPKISQFANMSDLWLYRQSHLCTNFQWHKDFLISKWTLHYSENKTNFVFFLFREKIVRKFLLFSYAFLISLITVMSRTQRKPLEACTETFYWSFLRTFMRIWLFRLLALHMVWNSDLPQFCGFPSKKRRKKLHFRTTHLAKF